MLSAALVKKRLQAWTWNCVESNTEPCFWRVSSELCVLPLFEAFLLISIEFLLALTFAGGSLLKSTNGLKNCCLLFEQNMRCIIYIMIRVKVPFQTKVLWLLPWRPQDGNVSKSYLMHMIFSFLLRKWRIIPIIPIDSIFTFQPLCDYRFNWFTVFRILNQTSWTLSTWDAPLQRKAHFYF